MTEGAAQLPPSDDSPERQDQDVPVTEGRDRKALAAEIELNPLSLVGSWFHRIDNGKIVWDGIVVAEPQAGKYLLHVRQGLEGAERAEAQVLVSVEQMLARDEGYEFRLFDSEQAMVEAYAEYVVTQEAWRP